tara:strand:- start:3601 stop:4884 length:1284 start_codon:yes stop_codon:yes gene_type:complete
LEINKKIKILTLSDHPLSASGVANQTKFMIEGLLEKYPGKYEFVCLGGAMKHQSYDPIIIDQEKFGDAWTVMPVDGYGTQEQVRSVLRTTRPDILWFMTDPRFFAWLWNMENEIRPLVPMVYYHVWDNFPAPHFNKRWYEGCDLITTISKVTSKCVQEVVPDVPEIYLPHAVDDRIFRKLKPEEYAQSAQILYDKHPDFENRVGFFWNNRNARRKQSGSLIYWFKQLCEEIGNEKAFLLMHTDPRDIHGQPLDYLIDHFGLKGQVIISSNKVAPEQLAQMYNMVDCTINVSDAEGFGLSTLESLSCETPIIATMTGGLQEQVTDGENWFGIGIEPASKSVIGSQEVPWIYEDRVSGEDVVAAMKRIVEMSPEERAEMGALGKNHLLKNYNFTNYVKNWDKILTETHQSMGSWQTRKGYTPWKLEEIV